MSRPFVTAHLGWWLPNLVSLAGRFNRLRQHRAVATRYDKRDFTYRRSVDVAAIRIWLRDLTHQDLQDTP